MLHPQTTCATTEAEAQYVHMGKQSTEDGHSVQQEAMTASGLRTILRR